MSKHRTEKDFIGEIHMPNEAYYGINTARGYENFNINEEKPDSLLIKTIAWVKKACALANLEDKKIDSLIANAIITACDKISGGGYDDQFIVHPVQGGGGTSFNMNANEVIANIALEILVV